MHAFPRSFEGSYRLEVTHTPTGLKASFPFRLLGSWETSEQRLQNDTEQNKPTPTAEANAVCVEGSAENREHPFGGGDRVNGSFLLCTPEQIAAIDQYCGKIGPCSHFELGANLDFGGNVHNPIRTTSFHFDGKGYSISNYVVVDSERDRVGFFASSPFSLKNTIFINPTIRGNRFVGAAAGYAVFPVENVHVVGGSIWGKEDVGGLIGHAALRAEVTWNKVGVYDTEIRYESGRAGGIVGQFNGTEPNSFPRASFNANELRNCFFSGRIAAAGVPAMSSEIGAIVGQVFGAVVRNCISKGIISSLNDKLGLTAIGGIVGRLRAGKAIDNFSDSILVSTGSGVGGIVGVFDYYPKQSLSNSGFGIDLVVPPPHINFARLGSILRNRFSGSAWGGMSRRELNCLDEVVVVIGVGGSADCVGDSSSGTAPTIGESAVGGIVGQSWYGLIQENIFDGSVRGIRGVGGIAGGLWGDNLVRNESKGKVSASYAAEGYGALVGTVTLIDEKIDPRLDRNIIGAASGNPIWSIGRYGSSLKSTVTNNVPDRYLGN